MTAIEHYEKYFDTYLQTTDGVLQASRSVSLLETLESIWQHAELSAGQKVLDCGGGVGLPAAYFATKGCHVDSLNITPKQIEFAKEKFGDLVNFKLHSFDKLDDLPEQYDRILFLESIGHTGGLFWLMQSCFKKLKPGGILYIKHAGAVSNEKHLRDLEKFYAYKFFKTSEVAEAAIRAGFNIKEISTIQYSEPDAKPSLAFIEATKADRGAEIDFTSLDSKHFVFNKES